MLIRGLERTYRDLRSAYYVPHDKFLEKFSLPSRNLGKFRVLSRNTAEEYRDSTPVLLDLKRAECLVFA